MEHHRRRVRCQESDYLDGTVKYDETGMPAVYDRGRVLAPEVLDLWMGTIQSRAGATKVGAVLDLGCGTGRFSDALPFWADSFDLVFMPMVYHHLADPARVARECRRAAGFRATSVEIITQEVSPDWNAYAEKTALGADSVLSSLEPSRSTCSSSTRRTRTSFGA